MKWTKERGQATQETSGKPQCAERLGPRPQTATARLRLDLFGHLGIEVGEEACGSNACRIGSREQPEAERGVRPMGIRLRTPVTQRRCPLGGRGFGLRPREMSLEPGVEAGRRPLARLAAGPNLLGSV